MQDRRDFLSAALGLLAGGVLGSALRPSAARAAERAAAVGGVSEPELQRALASSPYVYISPLRADGAESRCHGEVWYGWIDGGVVIITARDRWKARSLARGRDRARIWVGDAGRVKGLLGESDAFRRHPHFDAVGEISPDAALLDRLLAGYERKYPDEIGEWRERMRIGFRDGSRVLIRYRPLAAPKPP